MTCKLTQIVKDILQGDKDKEEFVLVIDGKEYWVFAKKQHSFLRRKLQGIHISIERNNSGKKKIKEERS